MVAFTRLGSCVICIYMMSCSVKFGQGQVKQLVAHGKGLLHYSNGRLLSSPSIQVAFPPVLS